jgi:hypothetical protein
MPSCRPYGGIQLLDLGRCQVLAAAQFPVRAATGQGNFPIFGVWGRLATARQVKDLSHG